MDTRTTVCLRAGPIHTLEDCPKLDFQDRGGLPVPNTDGRMAAEKWPFPNLPTQSKRNKTRRLDPLCVFFSRLPCTPVSRNDSVHKDRFQRVIPGQRPPGAQAGPL